MIMEGKEFIDTYWKYYLNLENEFIDTQNFVAIDYDNRKTFSTEYLKIFLLTCAEIDVVAKVFCAELESGFNKDTMPYYCKVLTNHFVDFKERVINFIPQRYNIYPWEDWTYTESKDRRGVQRVNGSGPEWWSVHNKVKHSRTLVNKEDLTINFKKANQKNVINALAGLYQIEMYFYAFLAKKAGSDILTPIPKSKLFYIDSWDSCFVPSEENPLIFKEIG